MIQMRDIEDLGYSPTPEGINKAFREGLITWREADILRQKDYDDWVRDLQDYQEKCRLAEEVRQVNLAEEARQHAALLASWEVIISKEIDAALAAFDAEWAKCPEDIRGTLREEYNNWMAQCEVYQSAWRAVERATSFPPTVARVRILRRNCQPRKRPESGEVESCGPGGAFMSRCND